MKKFVLKLDLEDDKENQRRALKTVSTLSGIDEICVDGKGKKLTVIGTVDPVTLVSKLRKRNWSADIISVGPAKEPEKKEEAKEEPKKEEAKKEEPKKEEVKEEAKKEEAKNEDSAAKKEEAKKDEEKKATVEPEMVLGTVLPFPYRPEAMPMPMPMPMPMSMPYRPEAMSMPMPMPMPMTMPYRPYYPPMNTHYYAYNSLEENPNSCII